MKGDAAITVVDTGRGIAPEHLPNIFQPFYTAKGNGTGLGLSLARRIAEEHHGRNEVTSEVGKGTKFLVVPPPTSHRARRGILNLSLVLMAIFLVHDIRTFVTVVFMCVFWPNRHRSGLFQSVQN